MRNMACGCWTAPSELSVTVDRDQGVLLMNRGAILMRTGRWQEALAQFTAAEPLLEADPYQLAGVLINRGVLYLSTGNVRRARGDFVKGRDIAGRANLAAPGGQGHA